MPRAMSFFCSSADGCLPLASLYFFDSSSPFFSTFSRQAASLQAHISSTRPSISEIMSPPHAAAPKSSPARPNEQTMALRFFISDKLQLVFLPQKGGLAYTHRISGVQG